MKKKSNEEYQKKYREKNKDHIRELKTAWQKENRYQRKKFGIKRIYNFILNNFKDDDTANAILDYIENNCKEILK